MSISFRSAPGSPGSPARWTSSTKTGVGTALSDKSDGIFNEIYYPRLHQACVRDMEFLATTTDAGLGIYVADLPIQGSQVRFTLYWPDAHNWQGTNFVVLVGPFKRESGADAGQD